MSMSAMLGASTAALYAHMLFALQPKLTSIRFQMPRALSSAHSRFAPAAVKQSAMVSIALASTSSISFSSVSANASPLTARVLLYKTFLHIASTNLPFCLSIHAFTSLGSAQRRFFMFSCNSLRPMNVFMFGVYTASHLSISSIFLNSAPELKYTAFIYCSSRVTWQRICLPSHPMRSMLASLTPRLSTTGCGLPAPKGSSMPSSSAKRFVMPPSSISKSYCALGINFSSGSLCQR